MKRNTILHGIGALLSVLVYAFFALPYYTVKVSPDSIVEGAKTAGVPVGSTSGYNFLKTALKQTSGSATSTFATVMALLTLIVAGITFCACVVALLNDFEVIKNEKAVKVTNIILLVSSILLSLCCILNLIGNACFESGDLQDRLAGAKMLLASLGGTLTTSAGWALTVITSLLAFGTCATSCIKSFKNKKENNN